MPMSTAVIGRQPIVDRQQDVFGYELLFRAVETSASAYDFGPGHVSDPRPDGDAMSATVAFNAMSIGIERVTGSKTMFCNADRGMLTGRLELNLPPQQTVIEVLETVTIDDEVLAGCRHLKKAGYRLAADDFEWFTGAERLLEVVDIVKIDLRRTPLDTLDTLDGGLGRYQRFDVQLLAEKVENQAELATCEQMGFDLFQGYYLGKPSIVADPALGPSHQGVLRLANALLGEESDFAAIEQVLRGEPALSYRLLQLACIGRMGETRRNVRSIREALITVGLQRVRGWLPALLLHPAGHAIDSALPSVLSRARMAELLATRLYPDSAGFAFTAGMLSAFDLLLGVPPDELPEKLQIPYDLRDAVFGGTIGIGTLISAVRDYQLTGANPSGLPGIDEAVMDETAAQAFCWAVQMSEQLDTPPES